MKLPINTVLVDDKEDYAMLLANCIENWKNEARYSEFTVSIYYQRGFYRKVTDYLESCIKKRIPVDLMFCDYHLEQSDSNNNGISLFNIFYETNQKPFKVLQSYTSRNLHKTKKENNTINIDDEIRTKEPKEILECLKAFDLNIAKVKLYGNPTFFSSFYEDSEQQKIRKDALQKIKENNQFRIIDILYISTVNRTHTILYRSNEAAKTIALKTFIRTSDDYNQTCFAMLSSGLPFARLNESLTINLLWVSKIDIVKMIVSFITPNSCIEQIHVKNLSKQKELEDTFKNYITVLSEKLHPYFV